MGAIIEARKGQVWFPNFRVEDAITSHGRVAVDHSMEFRLINFCLTAWRSN